MNNLISRKTLMVALAAVGFASVALPSAAIDVGEETFACEVQTKAGVAGLVFIQADSVQEAKAFDLNSAKARAINGQKSEALSIVQCIDSREGRFSDSTFQAFYKSLPR